MVPVEIVKGVKSGLDGQLAFCWSSIPPSVWPALGRRLLPRVRLVDDLRERAQSFRYPVVVQEFVRAGLASAFLFRMSL